MTTTDLAPGAADHSRTCEGADRLDCPVCRARDPGGPTRSRPEWVRSCRRCRLARAWPSPNDDELARIYDQGYFRRFGFDGDVANATHRMKQAGFRRLLVVAERLVHTGRLLDVGSGVGDLLFVASRRGWRAEGVESNSAAADEAERLAPGATQYCRFEDLSAEPRFDLVTCTDVLEHLRRPDDVMRRIYGLLRPGGALVLTTIDAGSIAARLSGRCWVHYHRDHLWYFERQNLQQLAERTGFTIVSCRRAWKVMHLDYVLRVLANVGRPALLRLLAARALTSIPEFVRQRCCLVPEGLLLTARKDSRPPDQTRAILP